MGCGSKLFDQPEEDQKLKYSFSGQYLFLKFVGDEV
jgi:hypothetical protein